MAKLQPNPFFPATLTALLLSPDAFCAFRAFEPPKKSKIYLTNIDNNPYTNIRLTALMNVGFMPWIR
jgi:hypothetical protein